MLRSLQKPLIFLHTYHHVITLWLCWVCLDDLLSIQWCVPRVDMRLKPSLTRQL